MFLEQSFHHPPITHYYMVGPNKNYIFHGFSNYSSTAGLNSLKLINKGKRFFEFPDGTKISSTQTNVFLIIFKNRIYTLIL